MNCQQGDLAVIVNSYEPEFDGLIVVCKYFVPAGVRTTSPDGVFDALSSIDAWMCEAPRVMPQTCEETGRRGYSQYLFVTDKHLRPLRPGALSDETTETKEKEST